MGSGYPEPVGGKFTPLNALGYYDKDKAGQTRPVRNDLGGSLPGMVQFAQSHTVDPSGNAAKDMPTLAAEREALLLVTPDPALGEADAMRVAVTVNGVSKGTVSLRHPNEMFRSDYAATDGRPDYVYSRRAWTAVLPWDWVRPGLALQVSDDKGRSGQLADKAIEFAAPAELVVHSIRLGMLTEPPQSDSGHWFRTHAAEAASDYFQTIPAARITAAHYEDVRLNRVMVASGTVYTVASTGNGDVYSGDMRENTAKSTFSVGINLANNGVTSSGMVSQTHPHLMQSVVIHHARGAYANGIQGHGLSGGNGILTLYSSRGNEFSHEIGHHYGLGHYPGQQGDNYFWAAHHHDSGWGYIAYRKRMRANLLWGRATSGGLNGVPVLDNTYRFAPDAMAGGDFTSSLSVYTHYTGFSTRRQIQPSLDKAVPTLASPTGYRKWNASTRAMENHAPAIPKQDPVWFNSSTGQFLPPRQVGVPVVTLLGGYDPQSDKAEIYPALRGNWGNVFALPTQAVDAAEPRQCWLTVSFLNGTQTRIALAGKRMQRDSVNKFHVNLAQADQPRQATLSCQTPGAPALQLAVVDIPVNQAAMPAPVTVGREASYTALRKVEMPALEAELLALAKHQVLSLSANGQLLYDSHAEHAAELSPAAQAQLKRYAQQQEQALRLNRWMATYDAALRANAPGAQAALTSFIQALQLWQTPLIPAAQTLTMGNGNCVQKTGDTVRVAGKSLCTGDANEQWLLDGRGAIRSRADLSVCLTDQGGSNAIRLAPCDARNAQQAWDTSVPKRIARGGRCMDLSSGFLTNNLGKLITYTCSAGSNQQWSGLVASDNLLIALVSSQNVHHIERLAATAATKRR